MVPSMRLFSMAVEGGFRISREGRPVVYLRPLDGTSDAHPTAAGKFAVVAQSQPGNNPSFDSRRYANVAYTTPTCNQSLFTNNQQAKN